jgi:hypothetical protein
MVQRREWRSSGFAEEIPAHVDKVPPYSPALAVHFWIVTTAYRVAPQLWRGEHTPMLDRENLVMVSPPGCYYCEQLYTPELARRRCPGDPAGVS